MPFMYELKLDFNEDWTRHLKKLLENAGYKTGKKDTDIHYQYFNLMNRLVEPTPRKVLVSKEFNIPEGYEDAIQAIKVKIEKGEDINSHLSTSLLDSNYNDGLLNDWGIYHLHLGTKLKKIRNKSSRRKGMFVERTGPLLFMRFDKEKAYMINVMQHNNWAKKEVIKIIHENWPESIEKYLMKGIQLASPQLDDEAHEALRKHGITTMVQIEKDMVYMPLGGGIASNGDSTSVVMTCMRYSKLIQELELKVKNNYMNYIKEGEKRGIRFKNRLHFCLRIIDDVNIGTINSIYLTVPQRKLYAQELHSGLWVDLNTNI